MVSLDLQLGLNLRLCGRRSKFPRTVDIPMAIQSSYSSGGDQDRVFDILLHHYGDQSVENPPRGLTF